jgi:hypothetical protein
MSPVTRLLVSMACLVPPCASPADRSPAECPEIPYEAPLATATQSQPLIVDRMEGQVVVAVPQIPRMLGPVRGFCLALFTQSPVKSVATSSSDEQGMFVFENVPKGDYVLIGRHESGEGGTARVLVQVSGQHQDRQNRDDNVGRNPDPSQGLNQSANALPNQVRNPARSQNSPLAAARGLLLRIDRHGGPQTARGEVLQNLNLRRTLLDRLNTDQDIRMKMIGEGMASVSPETQAQLEAVDRETEAMLSSIVREHGWPGLNMVGVDGTQAASTMLQHASGETAKRTLPLVEAAFRARNVLGPNYASLVDKVRIAEGRPQLYGTSAKPFDREGEIVFHPIEDESHMDARRAEMGLPPLEEYRKLLRRMYFPDTPQDTSPPAPATPAAPTPASASTAPSTPTRDAPSPVPAGNAN